MARVFWKFVLSCLAWLAVTIVAKSDAGGPEKVAQYMLYTIMFKYTTTEDGKPPPGLSLTNKELEDLGPDYWKRDKMPMLPFRQPRPPSKITNRGKKDASRGRESEMLEFPDWLDANSGLDPYDTLTDNLKQADSARRPGRNLQWTPDDLALGTRVWNQGFGGTLKMLYARGTKDTNYASLMGDLQNRFTQARKWFPEEVKADARPLGPVVDKILEMRENDFWPYLDADVEYVFFTKKNAAGKPIDKDGKEIDVKRITKEEFKKRRVMTGKIVESERHEAPNGETWSKIDVPATVRLKENRAALLAAFGGLPEGEAKSERKWLKSKLLEWCDNYGDSTVKPEYPDQAKTHKTVMDGWKKVKAEVDACM